MSEDRTLAIMESAVHEDFQRRWSVVRERMKSHLTENRGHPEYDVTELTLTLCSMSSGEIHDLLRHVVEDTRGARTLEGIEALNSFLGNYMLDDADCIVAPEPDAEDLDSDMFYAARLAMFRRGKGVSEEEARARALDAYSRRDRCMVVLPGDHESVRCAGPGDVLAAIAFNRELDVRRLARLERFEELRNMVFAEAEDAVDPGPRM